MRLVNSKYFDVINISDENPETLVLENPNHFMGVLQSLKYQCETDVHSPEKRNGSSGLTARRSASVERCEMAVTRD